MLKIMEDTEAVLENLLSRSERIKKNVRERVQEILSGVSREGDRAVWEFTRRFDRAEINAQNFKVTGREIEEAYNSVRPAFLDALRLALKNVRDFHMKQKEKSWLEAGKDGSILGQLVRPLSRVGIYVPGGTASYPSSVVMNVVPAKVAGVAEIIMVTPPDADGRVNCHTLVAASECGVSSIFKAGGAQGIAALAFGTETVPKVDKISGPGNVFVTEAKRQVYGEVNIDMIAGPSEVLIVADEGARADFIAADLLSQAEHDPLAVVALFTTSRILAEKVQKKIIEQLQGLPRREIAAGALKRGVALIVSSIKEALELANQVAPEHLELSVKEPFKWLGRVENAGAVFLGNYTTESVGDYIAGPNHILPTGGTARFYSPLGVADFLKRTSIVYYSTSKLLEEGPAVAELAEVEGLVAHSRAVELRLEYLRKVEENANR